MQIVIEILNVPIQDYQDLYHKIYGMAASEGLFDDKEKSQRALALKVVLDVLNGVVNGTPLTNALEYLETAYTGARACDDVAEQVRLARAIAAYKQDVYENCTVLDQIRAEIETEKNAGCHTWYAGGLDFSMSIIDKYKAERSGTDAKEKINPYKKCKTCGQDKASCCGCPEVLELERRIRKE